MVRIYAYLFQYLIDIYLSQPKAVFFTCMDSRMIPTRFTETHVGDMFVGKLNRSFFSVKQISKQNFLFSKVRNAGNLVPNAQHFQDEYYSCEPAALELGCVVNNIRHIIVCGHSDCKAMNLLYTLRNKEEATVDQRRISPLKAWLCAHAANTSLERFLKWKEEGMKDPLIFSSETPLRKFIAYIDPENKFNVEDKLSQINTLEQCKICFLHLKRIFDQILYKISFSYLFQCQMLHHTGF